MDKKISELAVANTINDNDIGILVHNGTDYQFAYSVLLQYITNSLNLGSLFSFGTTLPQNTTGKNGDVFIKTNTGQFAQKIAGTWAVTYTLPSAGGATDGSVLYGSGIPGSSIGNNNDTYINTSTGVFYKKTTGDWAQVFSMQTGPAGIKGDKGDAGATGNNGKTILSGPGNPSNSLGTTGDFYINTNNYTFFGPKTAGVWGTGIVLVSDVDKSYVDDQDEYYNNLAQDPANILQTSSFRFATDTEKGIWNGKENPIAPGTTNQYWRGDKTWQTLDTSAVSENGNLYYTDTRVQSYGDNNYAQLTGATFTGDVQLPSSPVNADSAINKGYLDNLLTGLTWKQEVRAATIANITLSGTQTVDGVALVAGNRVLVKNQTTGAENGIYDVITGAWTRSSDADTTAEIETATVLVRLGIVNKNTQWTNSNSNEPIIGTDTITFAQISGAGTYTNGTGISLTGNVFSIDASFTANASRTGYLSASDWSNIVFKSGYTSQFVAGILSSTQISTGQITSSSGSNSSIINGTAFYGYAGTNMILDAYLTLSSSSGVKISAPLMLIGTGGSGYMDILAQSSAPGTPASGHQYVYADASGRFTIVGSNGFAVSLSKANLTASRVYSFVDATGTLPLLETANIWSGAYNTFNLIGIGPNTPITTMDINTTNSRWSITTADNSNSSVAYFGKAFGSPTAPTIPTSIQSIGKIVAAVYNGTGLLTSYTNAAEIKFIMSDVPTTTSTPSDIVFSTVPIGALSLVERMRISSEGKLSVGVGFTGSLNNVFTVVGNQTTGLVGYQNLNIAGYSSFDVFDNTGAAKMTFGYANTSATSFAGLAYINGVSADLIFARATVEKMRISTSSVSTSTLFSVVNNASSTPAITIQNTNIAGYSSLDFYDSANVKQLTFGYANASVSAGTPSVSYMDGSVGGPLTFRISAAEKMRIASNGISTTTLFSAINNASGAPAITAQNTNVAGHSSLEFYDSSSVKQLIIGYANASVASGTPSLSYINSVAGGPLTFRISTIERMRLTSVGMGFNGATPTHTVTYGLGGTGMAIYNSGTGLDNGVTNYESLTFTPQNGGAYQISSNSLGTGITRDIILTAGASQMAFSGVGVTGTNAAVEFRRNSTSISSLLAIASLSLQSTAIIQSALLIAPTINQASGTGGYNGLWMSIYEKNILGSGTKYLLNLGTNSADSATGTHVVKYSIDNLGNTLQKGSIGLSGPTSGIVTLQTQSVAGTYNFNLPTTAGSAGQILTSQGGGSSAMTWSSAPVLSSANTWTNTNTFSFGITSVVALAITSGYASISGSTSGTVDAATPFNGGGYKKVILYCNALTGTATYNFTSTFFHTPVILNTSGLSTSVVTSLSTTSVTVTGSSTTGFLILEGF